MKITKGYFITKLSQIGNAGAHQIQKIKEQPKEGFATQSMAEVELMKLIETKGTFYYPWDSFTILFLFESDGKI